MLIRRSTRLARRTASLPRGNARFERCFWPLWTMCLEDRVMLSAGLTDPSASAPLLLPVSVMNSAVPITLGSPKPNAVGVGGANFYEIEPGSDGALIAQAVAQSSSLQLRLSLYDGEGNLLVQSDGQSSGQLNPLIDFHITAGTDYLEVEGLAGSGDYTLSTSLTPSSDPGQTVAVSQAFQGDDMPIAVGDFTNNGILDIVTPDGVHLGLGDGTFEAPTGPPLVDPSLNESPLAIAVGNFYGDGNLDAAVAFSTTDINTGATSYSVSIFQGEGNGSFGTVTTIALPNGSTPEAMLAGDFLGNGRTDLAIVDSGINAVTIILSNGDGTFQVPTTFDDVGQGPVAITEGDFENDGRMDLAVADFSAGTVTILSNQGGGNFEPLAPISLPALATPSAIVAGDFGTGSVDLAVTDSYNGVVDILQGHGNGTFTLGPSYAVGNNPSSLVTGNFGNGQLDLAVADANANDVSVLLGNGNGTFQPATSFGVGTTPFEVVAGNFTGNGRLDLATANSNYGSGDISVLLGKGDGTFEEPTSNQVGFDTTAEATGDFTGNGNLGLAVVNQGSDSITILPGNGDGTFQQSLTVALPPGAGATSIVAADFNDDGRTDLAVAEPGLNEVAIFLGNGDGTFNSLPPISVPGGPYALVAGDFTGNGRIDLAVADQSSSSVTILLGNGDGTFDELPPIPLANPYSNPDAIVAGDFGNGHLDLAVADPQTNDVTILLGNGDGTFQVQTPISLGFGFPSTISLVAGDFTGNGVTDLAVAVTDYIFGDSVDILLGNGDGTFQAPNVMSLGYGVYPVAIAAGDFTHNGVLDLATADNNGDGSDDYSIYLGNGDGTFQGPKPYAIGGAGASTALVVGDFTGNGQSDLAITRTEPDDLAVELSNGDGTFSSPSVVDLARRDTPLVADLNGDGAPDVAVVDAAGDILYRAGRPGEPGSFAPPITVNPGDPSRDIAFVTTEYGPTIASVDADDNAISFFVLRSTGFVLVGKLTTGFEPAEIIAADLDDNGITDLIVRNAGDGTLSVFDGDGQGWFLPPVTLQVGLGASDIEAASLQQDGLLDIVYTNRISGEVGVIENLGGGSFGTPVLYQAGPGPYGVTGTSDPSPVFSLEGTTSAATITLTSGGLPSLVALDPGSDNFGLLMGLGDGELANATYVATPAPGLVIHSVDFNGDGKTGLAVLTSVGLFIYVPNGQGGFLSPNEYNVGFEPNGLTVANLDGNGNADLLISNALGDVQVLIGDGNGMFAARQNLDQQVGLAVYAPSGTTPAAFIFTDQATDQLIVTTAGGVTSVLGDASTGLISPGAVALADLNNNGILDLIVANSGSNNVLIYPGLGNGAFGPAINDGNGFFTGTDPVGITVADLTGNRRPDLIITNQGSNNVTILLNVQDGNSFTFEQGPVLQAGVGPVSTVVANVLGNGVPALVVANSGSNDLWLLPGLGNGYFNDQSPIILPVGTDPSELFAGQFTSGSGQDLVTVNAGSDNLTLISGLGSASPIFQTISSGGIDPTSAFAVPLTTNGSEGLVVANNADGNISLFEPGDNGLAFASALSTSGLPNPSSLALASFSGGNLEFYATNDGEASASLLGFQLEEGGTSGLSLSEASGSAQLLSLNDTSLALVGTLLTLTLELEQESEQTSEDASSAVASTGPGGSGQSTIGRSGHSNDIEEEVDEAAEEPAANAPPVLAWARFVAGLDEVIEALRNEFDARLLQEAQPAKADEAGSASLNEEDAAVRPAADTTSFHEQEGWGTDFGREPNDDWVGAIDAAIDSWGSPKSAAGESIFPVLPDSSITKSSRASLRVIDLQNGATLFPMDDVDQPDRVDVKLARDVILVAIPTIAIAARERLRNRALWRLGAERPRALPR